MRKQPTVKAIDIHTGSLVDIPDGQTIEIEAAPRVSNPYGGDGTPAVPAMQRAFRQPVPTKLLCIQPASFDHAGPWPRVFYRHARKVWFESGGKQRYRVRGSCYVRHDRDACDPLFDQLSESERALIAASVLAFHKEFAKRRGGEA